MVRALALVAVRQQQDDAGLLAPLLLARADELVHDRLGAVDEVAELGLPADQRVRPGDRVAVLEADRRVLRQQRVVGVEPGRLGVERPQRHVFRAGVPVDQHRVPLAERAAAGVLADQPDRVPVDQDRAEGQQLAGAPSRSRPAPPSRPGAAAAAAAAGAR